MLWFRFSGLFRSFFFFYSCGLSLAACVLCFLWFVIYGFLVCDMHSVVWYSLLWFLVCVFFVCDLWFLWFGHCVLWFLLFGCGCGCGVVLIWLWLWFCVCCCCCGLWFMVWSVFWSVAG